MKSTFTSAALALSGIFLCAEPSLKANDADNSANNATDRNGQSLTPMNQSNADQDVQVTRNIRRAIVKDSSLSVYAHNIKIITTKDHQVFLRGSVSSSDEVDKIARIAQQNAGSDAVMNQLSVKQ